MTTSLFIGLWAQGAALAGNDPAVLGPDGSGLVWLIVVMLALLGGAAFLHRRVVSGRGGGANPLRMVSSLPLGEKRAIVMIEADRERLLVGVTSQSIQLLSELGPVEATELVAQSESVPGADEEDAVSSPSDTRSRFASSLRVALERGLR